MQSHFAKAIIHNIAKLVVEVFFLKVGFDIIRHVEIIKSSLIFVFVMFHALSRRIELVCILN